MASGESPIDGPRSRDQAVAARALERRHQLRIAPIETGRDHHVELRRRTPKPRRTGRPRQAWLTIERADRAVIKPSNAKRLSIRDGGVGLTRSAAQEPVRDAIFAGRHVGPFLLDDAARRHDLPSNGGSPRHLTMPGPKGPGLRSSEFAAFAGRTEDCRAVLRTRSGAALLMSVTTPRRARRRTDTSRSCRRSAVGIPRLAIGGRRRIGLRGIDVHHAHAARRSSFSRASEARNWRGSSGTSVGAIASRSPMSCRRRGADGAWPAPRRRLVEQRNGKRTVECQTAPPQVRRPGHQHRVVDDDGGRCHVERTTRSGSGCEQHDVARRRVTQRLQRGPDAAATHVFDLLRLAGQELLGDAQQHRQRRPRGTDA